ncbi:50S ribosomal protein L10 [Oleisolibacter albus]|uniref:50S ribosomal protein L10 n=1 Tax=Oleisolibacter albus TaxID=2171757 RepID=UPI000DF4A345|nr:50S ribosomal protein L10 [Oleisolibacter albus]
MDRTQKEATVAALNSQLQKAGLIVVTKQSGMTVAEVSDLRRKMRAAGASYKVTKNRLARIALKGTQFEGAESLFKGPTAIAYSVDPVAAAKVAIDYAKTNDKFQIVGGGLGAQTLDAKGIEALSKLPSLNELRASLLGMIQTPATRIAGILQQPGGQVARVLAAYAKKDEAA